MALLTRRGRNRCAPLADASQKETAVSPLASDCSAFKLIYQCSILSHHGRLPRVLLLHQPRKHTHTHTHVQRREVASRFHSTTNSKNNRQQSSYFVSVHPGNLWQEDCGLRTRRGKKSLCVCVCVCVCVCFISVFFLSAHGVCALWAANRTDVENATIARRFICGRTGRGLCGEIGLWCTQTQTHTHTKFSVGMVAL